MSSIAGIAPRVQCVGVNGMFLYQDTMRLQFLSNHPSKLFLKYMVHSKYLFY